MRTLPILALVCSCGTTAQYGFTVWGQEKHTLNTVQTCIRGAEAARFADLAIPIILDELTKSKFIKQPWSELVNRNRQAWTGRPIVGVCLVPEPESCCIGSACAEPHKEIGDAIAHARKTGCASDSNAWASLAWPPVCTTAWPNEPHCVQPIEVKNTGWEVRLFHELFNLAIQRWAGYQGRGYTAEIYKVEALARARLTQ